MSARPKPYMYTLVGTLFRQTAPISREGKSIMLLHISGRILLCKYIFVQDSMYIYVESREDVIQLPIIQINCWAISFHLLLKSIPFVRRCDAGCSVIYKAFEIECGSITHFQQCLAIVLDFKS